MNQTPVTPKQMDAIREVVNIGAGHAATNLSALTGLTVMISVPRIQWAGLGAALPGTGDLVVITVPISGVSEAGGEHASLILATETALRMVALMLRRDPSRHVSVGELERSALQEMGNIVCAAYVGVLGTFLNKGVMIGTPVMEVGPREELAPRQAQGLVIETDFTFLDTTFEGVFVLSHSDVSFTSLLSALGFDVARPGDAG
ncbi:MAG TPA: chemotaxis protein CheC [Longimicrobium sp.]|jgi:chemotaxis protein CheC|uniref:chemotaxis protein CheC n=1 Tax=Longimicrobium sp. TaxID=2029185 RepID=UPI002ED8A4C7